jgi:hypothetical protein
MRPGDSDTVRNYVLTDAAAAVLDSFNQPRSVSEFEKNFPEETGFPAPPAAFLEALVSRQLLQPARIEAQ